LSGYADMPLAAFEFGAVLKAARWLERPSWRRALATGLLFGAAALTKKEGAIWIAVCGGTLSLTVLLRGRAVWPRLGTVLPGIGVILCALALGRAARFGIPDSPYYPSYAAALDWDWLRQLTGRPWDVLVHLTRELASPHNWNSIWFCVLLALLCLKRGRLPAHVWFWRLTALGMAGSYLAVFVLTPLDLPYQLSTSATRLILHVYPLAVLIMSEQLAASGWTRQFCEIVDANLPSDPPSIALPVADNVEMKPARAA
jgi:hypothetical protein